MLAQFTTHHLHATRPTPNVANHHTAMCIYVSAGFQTFDRLINRSTGL